MMGGGIHPREGWMLGDGAAWDMRIVGVFLWRLENPAALTNCSRKWQKAQNNPGAGKRPKRGDADPLLPVMKMVIDILEGNDGNDDPDKRDKNQAAKKN